MKWRAREKRKGGKKAGEKIIDEKSPAKMKNGETI
jgi:hypothetical protein